ncbi:MAG: histidinol-phosphate transaminase [Burkholderiales bacterium]|nr:histidinol-phosphate transaminase [Burkholderiales bacterium]
MPERVSPADLDARIARVVRDDIRALAGYRVADASGMIKLDAMENPFGLPGDVRSGLGTLAAAQALNRYPDPEARALKRVLRKTMQVPPGMELLLGNGSDEIIQLLALACARPGASMLGVEPSFAMFPLIARICGLAFVSVPLAGGFDLDTEAVLAAMARHRPALVLLAYPNNPTGNLFDHAALERIVAQAPGLVVIDEAYHPFARASFMSRLHDFPNLALMRTLSKLGLAGLRLGMLIGRPEWLAHIDKLRLPYNVNVLSQCAAAHVLEHGAILEQQAAAIRAERARLAGALAKLPGVHPYPSEANFILFRVARASALYDALKRRGILIKSLAGAHPALADCLRVSVGAPAENDAFLAALTASLPEIATSHA